MRVGLSLLLVFLVTLAVAPAQAHGRDDAMAGAYRCGVIADDRQWLDCYYGAAQTVRADIGLPAAPQAQLRLAASPPAGGEVRTGRVRGEVMVSAARCYLVTDDRQWLNCYYNAAQPIRTSLGMAPVAGPAPLPVEPSVFAVRKPAPEPQGAFSDWLGGSNDERIVSRVTSYKFDKYGIFTVTLDNGQVWQQLSGDTVYAHWKKPAATYIAVLTRGALGSIDLRLQGEPRIFKVSRLR